MKKLHLLLIAFAGIGFISCSVKRGCPSSGRNIGAERLLSGDKETSKALKKAGKFRS